LDKKYIFKDWRKIMRKLLLILSLFVINIVGLAYEKCNPKTIYEISVNDLNGSYFGQNKKDGTIMIKLGKNANKVQAIHFDENRILNNCILDPKITEFHIEHGLFINAMYDEMLDGVYNNDQDIKIDYDSCLEKNHQFCKISKDVDINGNPVGISFNQEVQDIEIHGNIVDVEKRNDYKKVIIGEGYEEDNIAVCASKSISEENCKKEKFIVKSPNGYVNLTRKAYDNSTVRDKLKNGTIVAIDPIDINPFDVEGVYVEVLGQHKFGYINWKYLEKK